MAQCLRCLRSARKKGNYKSNDLRELLLRVINALKKDKKNLIVIKNQLKAKCENQRNCLAGLKKKPSFFATT